MHVRLGRAARRGSSGSPSRAGTRRRRRRLAPCRACRRRRCRWCRSTVRPRPQGMQNTTRSSLRREHHQRVVHGQPLRVDHQVHALGGLQDGRLADQRAHLVAPRPGGVHHHLGAHLEGGPAPPGPRRAPRRPSPCARSVHEQLPARAWFTTVAPSARASSAFSRVSRASSVRQS